jgi:hypothetical protein
MHRNRSAGVPMVARMPLASTRAVRLRMKRARSSDGAGQLLRLPPVGHLHLRL